MPRRLKVYRTPMGFEDAVVAAPNQGEALKAWGVRSNLFAEGLAETVSAEPELEAEALASPGRVLRRPRGDSAAMLAQAGRSGRKGEAAKSKPSRAAEPEPAPDRSRLDKAEAALEEATRRQDRELAELDEAQAALDARRREVRDRGRKRVAEARETVARERKVFERRS